MGHFTCHTEISVENKEHNEMVRPQIQGEGGRGQTDRKGTHSKLQGQASAAMTQMRMY